MEGIWTSSPECQPVIGNIERGMLLTVTEIRETAAHIMQSPQYSLQDVPGGVEFGDNDRCRYRLGASIEGGIY